MTETLAFVPQDWTADASCAGTDPEMWFPERGAGNSRLKAICAGCPVRIQCLDYALDNNEEYGVWGGTSRNQRRAMRKARVELKGVDQ